MKLAFLFFIFGATVLKLDIDKTQLKNCQQKPSKQVKEYEELFATDGVEIEEDEKEGKQ
jgi:hypothetical protein